MKKIEILQAVPKCDRETLSEQILLENGTNRCAQYRVNIGFVQASVCGNTMSVKPNKAKHNKTRCACIREVLPKFGNSQPTSHNGDL